MYVQLNIQARSCNHCCSEKEVKITYCEGLLVISFYPAKNEHAPYCHLWPPRLYNISPHYLSNVTIFRKSD